MFAEQGRCVLFSTHYMDEAERLCDSIAIIVQGLIVAHGSPDELKASTGKSNLEEAFVALAGSHEGLMLSEYGRHAGDRSPANGDEGRKTKDERK
jgi:ABC-type Na+ transport system ATPase subunit NatA